jgi:hypothetical protein
MTARFRNRLGQTRGHRPRLQEKVAHTPDYTRYGDTDRTASLAAFALLP